MKINELILNKVYTYKNTTKVGRQCSKTKVERKVKYTGMDGNKCVFETESGSELLIHTDNIEKFISEVA